MTPWDLEVALEEQGAHYWLSRLKTAWSIEADCKSMAMKRGDDD